MAYNHEYYVRNKEKFLSAQKRYIAKKRAEDNDGWLKKQSEYMKEYYAEHPEQKAKKNEYNKNYYQTHKEYFKAKQKEYLEKKKKEEQEEKNGNLRSI